MKRNPRDPQAWLCSAGHWYRQGKYRKAIGHYSKALNIDPGTIDGWAGRAKAYGAQGQYKKTLEDIGEAIQRAPQNAGFYAIAAWAYHCLGHYEQEAEALNKALEYGYIYPRVVRDRIRDLGFTPRF